MSRPDLRGGFLARTGLLDGDGLSAAADLLHRAEAEGLETLRVLFADAHGVLRGKTVTAQALASVFTTGIRVPSSLLLKDVAHRTVFPIWSDSGDTPMQGAGDVVLVPDPATFRPLPWSPHSAVILCEVAHPDGTPVPLCARRILARAVEALAQDGLAARFGLEVEFQVFAVDDPALAHAQATMPPAPPATRNLNPGWQYLTDSRYDAAEDLLDDLRRSALAMDLPVRSVEIEMGPSQFEFTFDAADPLTTADRSVLFRTMAREVCQRRGLLASFMAKPGLPNAAANGWHVHQSLCDAQGRNLFVPDAPRQLTQQAGGWLAGLVEHTAAACIAAVPTVNGYKRFTPYQLAPTRIGWGWDNRGAAYRVLAAPADSGSRIENRVPDSTANPYLALAFQIHAGRDGLTRGLSAPPPLASPYDETAERLPSTLAKAIDRFAASPMLRAALGAEVADYLIHLKRAEWDRYVSAVSDWEQREYFTAF